MPFKSKSQRAYMHIHLPEIAKRWEKHTPKGIKLPYKVKKKKKKSSIIQQIIKQANLHDQIGNYKMANILTKMAINYIRRNRI